MSKGLAEGEGWALGDAEGDERALADGDGEGWALGEADGDGDGDALGDGVGEGTPSDGMGVGVEVAGDASV